MSSLLQRLDIFCCRHVGASAARFQHNRCEFGLILSFRSGSACESDLGFPRPYRSGIPDNGARSKKSHLEGNERIYDLAGHRSHESLPGLGFSLEVISNFRPSGSQGCGLEASIKKLIYVEGLTVEFEERFTAVGLISGGSKRGGRRSDKRTSLLRPSSYK